jgi:hypothetical protein
MLDEQKRQQVSGPPQKQEDADTFNRLGDRQVELIEIYNKIFSLG